MITGASRLPRTVINALSYSGGSIIGQAATLIYSVLLRHILVPSVMGLFDFVSVVTNFTANFDPGISTAAAIRLPALEGAGLADEATELRSTALWAEFAQSVIMALGVVIFVAAGGVSGRTTAPALVAAVVVILYGLFDALTTIHQAHGSYVQLSFAMSASSILGAVLLPGGAWIAGIHGLLVAAIAYWAAQATLLYLAARRAGVRIKRELSLPLTRSLLALGLPLRAVDVPQAFVGTLDLLIVTSLLGIKALAVYSFARLVYLQVATVPGPFANVFVMRAFRLTGAKVSRERLAADTRRFLMFEYLVLLPIVVSVAIQGMNLLTGTLLPAYSHSRAVLGYLIFAAFFVPQTAVVRNFWMYDRKFVKLGVSNLLALASHGLMLGLSIVLLGLSLKAIALGTLTGWIGYYLWIMATAGSDLLGRRVTLEVAASALVGAGISALLAALLPAVDGHGFIALLQSVRNILLATIVLIPLAAWTMNRTDALRALRDRAITR